MAYLIGDTIRLKATIKDLDGELLAPASINLTVYRADGTTKLLDAAVPALVAGMTSTYYYDWQISTSLTATERLIALWEWTGGQKKSMRFNVNPITEYAS
jgi:hypothetical protein